MKVLAFAGSLRRASYNRGVVRAAVELAPAGMTVEGFDLREIPLYDNDVERAGGPPAVHEFKRRIGAADALFISTPEYNYSVPGVLKNALDWASRMEPRVLGDKPVAVTGASNGMWGTIRGQTMLHGMLQGMGMHVLPPPGLFITMAGSKFDDSGNLTDPDTRRRLGELLQRLEAWVRRLA